MKVTQHDAIESNTKHSSEHHRGSPGRTYRFSTQLQHHRIFVDVQQSKFNGVNTDRCGLVGSAPLAGGLVASLL